MQDFNSTSEITATFVVSVYASSHTHKLLIRQSILTTHSYLLGFAFGPILIAPLSELYGRLYIYHACNLGYLVFTIACALATNMEMLIVFRFFAGCWVCPLSGMKTGAQAMLRNQFTNTADVGRRSSHDWRVSHGFIVYVWLVTLADFQSSGTVADLMRPEERGLAMSLWAMGALFGPILGNSPSSTTATLQTYQLTPPL